jgi:hypothetical protein
LALSHDCEKDRFSSGKFVGELLVGVVAGVTTNQTALLCKIIRWLGAQARHHKAWGMLKSGVAYIPTGLCVSLTQLTQIYERTLILLFLSFHNFELFRFAVRLAVATAATTMAILFTVGFGRVLQMIFR